MHFVASDYRKFYDTEIGGIVQNILSRHIDDLWPDTHGLRVLGCGFATPYLSLFCDNSERVFSMMPAKQGAEHWIPSKKNLTLLSEEDRMPIENSSVDRILLVHYLETCDNLKTSLREIWRILKPNGRLLVIVPNRMGVWAQTDWTPFGHGSPFTSSQLLSFLRDSMFVPEHNKGGLFVPPVPDSPVLMKSANIIEKMGCSIMPFVAGVHILEMSKQVYASADNSGRGSSVLAKTKEILAGTAKPATQRVAICDKPKSQVDSRDLHQS